MIGGPIVCGGQAGFLFSLACNAAGNIDHAIAKVIEVWCARWKIDPSRIGRMRGHFAQRERAIAAAQCAHSEAVKHSLVRKAPVAPGQKARKIRLEIIGAIAAVLENRVTSQQHAPVPQPRFLGLPGCKMRSDIGAPLIREWPGPRAVFQIELRNPMNGNRRHRLKTRPTSVRPPPS